MNIEQVFCDFCDNLQKRTRVTSEDSIRYYWFAAMLQNDKNLDLNNYSLEYPYFLNNQVFAKDPGRGYIGKKELDFLYNNGEECYCIEIKFHRNPDPNSTYAHPDAAGSLFNDLIRLSVFQPGKAFPTSNERLMTLPSTTRRFLLYVTDDEMHQYFSNSSKSRKCYKDGYRQPLSKFYQLTEKDVWEPSFFDKIPSTFINSTTAAFTNSITISNIPKVQLVCRRNEMVVKSDSFKLDSAGHRYCYIRLYEVLK